MKKDRADRASWRSTHQIVHRSVFVDVRDGPLAYISQSERRDKHHTQCAQHTSTWGGVESGRMGCFASALHKRNVESNEVEGVPFDGRVNNTFTRIVKLQIPRRCDQATLCASISDYDLMSTNRPGLAVNLQLNVVQHIGLLDDECRGSFRSFCGYRLSTTPAKKQTCG